MAQRKIAILGGGVGALSTAFQLTESANWRENYDITIYQLCWRLGGKGASGRSNDPSRQIEEHGLHVWFGFYNNAFRMIRKVYAEAAPLMPNSPFKTWTDAFQPQTKATLLESVGGEWKPWPVDMPARPGLPGDSSLFEELGDPSSPWTYVQNLLAWMTNQYSKIQAQVPVGFLDPQAQSTLAQSAESLPAGLESLAKPVLEFLPLSPGALLEMANVMAAAVTPQTVEAFSSSYNFILLLLQYFLDSWIQPSSALSDEIRRAAITFDLAVAAVRGMIASGVIFSGFDVINDWDYVEWLKHNGAKYADSVLIRNLYDGCFAYIDGDPKKPNMEAGTALRGHLRMMFDYRGAIVWRMNAGMGDTIFAPLYLLLKQRGVKFRFFRRVKKLSLSSDLKNIDKITLDVQANLTVAEYDPLITVNGLPCWPNEPRYEQLANPDVLRQYNLESWYTDWHDKIGQEELTRAQDFDDVVLGISLGAFPYICGELMAASPAWQKMVAKVGVVQTQALQLWLHKSAKDLGWEQGADLPRAQRAFVCGYVEPFDTYADMSHLIPRENWLPADNVQSVAYFCNCLQHDANIPAPFTDPAFPQAQLKRVANNVTQFLSNDVTVLWPKAGTTATPRALDPTLIRKDFIKANIDPPERYVLSTVGSSAFRLDPGNSQFANLYLAGDWTRNGLNGGCVEAAVTSGMAAAQSITGSEQHLFGFTPEHRFALETNAPQIAGNGDQIRKFWQDQAAAKLPPESQVIARNAAVTAVYASLYNTDKALFKWAGLASYASHRIGLLLLAYNFVEVGGITQILDATGVVVSSELSADLNLIRQMNNAVYQDVAWAHFAFQARGLNEVLAGLESLPDHEGIVRGFTQIEKGRQLLTDPHAGSEGANLIWAGNQDLLYHEQSVVLQGGYDHMNLSFESVLSVATAMDFNVTSVGYDPSLFTSFTIFMTTDGLLVLIKTGKPPQIGDLEQRWFWISRAVYPMWKGVDSGASGEMFAHGQAILLKERERADLLGGLWPIEKRPG